MCGNEDYISAAFRHWESCEILGNNHQWQDAAYLAGYIAECSMKGALEHAFGQARDEVRRFGHNLAQLHLRGLELAMVLNPAARRYWPDPLPQEILLWSPGHRYARTGCLSDGEFQRIVDAAEQIGERILLGMALDGLIPMP
ncbi:MAG: hypothetical protein RMK65_06565 [Anaerolineae bacterium]|nr:hypothetical protein [Anaerolineae bacterium]MDW7991787.1 hypothetical protein [Anaerolineae bacterium]